jgi:hypothetical protein
MAIIRVWVGQPSLTQHLAERLSRRCTCCRPKSEGGRSAAESFGPVNTTVPAGWVACRWRTATGLFVRIKAEKIAAQLLSHNSFISIAHSRCNACFPTQCNTRSRRRKKGFFPNAAHTHCLVCPRVRCILGRRERGWVIRHQEMHPADFASRTAVRWRAHSSSLRYMGQVCCYCMVAYYSSSTST